MDYLGGAMKSFVRRVAAGIAVLALSAGVMTAVDASDSQVAGASGSGSPIVIGLVCSCTGPLASAGADVPRVYKAWAASVNASGGINGHKVDVITKDDASNPNTSVTIVHSFIQSDHAIAILDDSNNDAAWASYAEQQGVPVVGM